MTITIEHIRRARAHWLAIAASGVRGCREARKNARLAETALLKMELAGRNEA